MEGIGLSSMCGSGEAWERGNSIHSPPRPLTPLLRAPRCQAQIRGIHLVRSSALRILTEFMVRANVARFDADKSPR